ncbi:uncharacterized protein MONOS_15204 [Monocercomonoides exilis]|uniref:uncharacterized protein n=1 Tax=Monocercomonoides exilis TaxID=2049356 RepID=UPI00355A2412|nr:hypothetical protein MONOS_15204 [Monocercomonoides exilis]|eukprot:MONOS_15204.1-p1 / transcript=MONOS_15204.1 / gene=MONOS_15204 / organism=Monocercomonoides_exilis_PA203 / gene_product=unspecified product / transcript_product=unspecified product / location=Mono_scaffold01169:9562-10140(-) / protein_length=193 / sequence_SO=supercontig / SO=protein_coding / is_pseudo=false
MECESDIMLGRSYFPASRFQHVERNHKRGDSIFGESGLDYQQGQMFINPEEKVHFSGVCMGYRNIYGSIERGEFRISQRDVESMDSESNKSQNSSNKGFCLSNWKAQRSKIRIPGCVTSPCSSSSSPAEEREDIRMKKCNEEECLSVERNEGVTMDIEPESNETFSSSVYSTSCSNDGCIRTSLVSNALSQQ